MDLLKKQNEIYRYEKSCINKDMKEMKHILGYFVQEPDETIRERMQDVMDELHDVITPAGVCSVFPISFEDDHMDLGFAKVISKDLRRNLRGCHHVIVCACTVGMEIDRKIRVLSRKNTLDGYLAQAAGAALAESLMNRLNADLKKEFSEAGYHLNVRFSCGYGDFELKHQKDIFNVLTKTASIGLTLMDTDIMAPSKSITALIGVSDSDLDAEGYLPLCDQCEICTKGVGYETGFKRIDQK